MKSRSLKNGPKISGTNMIVKPLGQGRKRCGGPSGVHRVEGLLPSMVDCSESENTARERRRSTSSFRLFDVR